jgi:ABC-type lipoprotein export system ATPase subunit
MRGVSGSESLYGQAIIGFVFQGFNLLPRTTGLENALMPLSCARESLRRTIRSNNGCIEGSST